MKQRDAGAWDWLQTRWFEFKMGDASYLRYVLNFIQFIIVAYTLYVPRLGWLQAFFQSILIFALAFFVVYIPVSIVVGRYLHRKRQLRKELTIAMMENPISAWINRVTLEQMITFMEKMKIPISQDYRDLYEFWKKLDEEMMWRAAY